MDSAICRFNLVQNILDSMTPEELQEREKRIEKELQKQLADQREAAFRGCGINEKQIDYSFKNYICETKDEERALNKVYSAYSEIVKNGRKNLILFSNPGAGKTHLLSALIHSLCYQRFNFITSDKVRSSFFMCRYTTSADIINRVAETQNFKHQETFENVISDYANNDVLVIDEIGQDVNLRNKEPSALFSVIDRLYRAGKSVAIASNLDFEELKRLLGSAIISRIMENATIVDMRNIRDHRINGMQ